MVKACEKRRYALVQQVSATANFSHAQLKRGRQPFLPFSLVFMGLFGSFRFSLAVSKQVSILSTV